MHLQTETWLPRPRRDVFAFFADARNLQTLTPPWLHFHILNDAIEMRAGETIDYALRLHGIPIRWRSEISIWDPPQLFVDEQRHGPYRHWIHRHVFEERLGGTAVRDEVDFDVPLRWLAAPFVARDLRQIFAYRHAALFRLVDHPLPSPPAIDIW